MSTVRIFQDMLNEYLPNRLLKEEFLKRDYILANTERDTNWNGGTLPVPFKAAGASSIRMGALTAEDDIARDEYVRGELAAYKEAWGTMVFDDTDLRQHNGKIPDKTFLKILPETIEDFLDNMKAVVSVQLGTGPHFSKATADGDASGVIAVDHIDRFMLGQKVKVISKNVTAIYYVIAIDINSSEVTVSASRGGAAVDISGVVVADSPKIYTDGADTDHFQSIRDALLTPAKGGSPNIHGKSKVAYPYLQAVNIDGSDWTADNVLSKLFDSYSLVRQRAKGKATEILMSYKTGGAILKKIEHGNTGNFQVSVGDKKGSLYGWDEIELSTFKGKLKLVMIQEWDDDIVVFRDPASMVFRSNGDMFEKRKGPEGLEYHTIRGTDGYKYILDIRLFGQLEVNKPGNNAIVHSINIS